MELDVRMTATSPPRLAYFESLYQAETDPYGVRDRWYEKRKRALLLDSLPRRRFTSAYEPGCGTGELTAQLAERCDHVLASDWSAGALQTAQKRNASYEHVTIERQMLPNDWPVARGPFDLIVLSELGYFLDSRAMNTVASHCAASLSDTGVLVACDWKPDFSERALSTRDVQATLSFIGLRRLVLHEEDDFVLRVWSVDPRSVAQREGIR